MEQRIIDLEIKQAFQEELLDTLNRIVIEQQQQITLLQAQVKLVYQQLKSLQPSNIALSTEDAPPPHY
ncbi:SlyX family protein [Agitococcus lubricus]|uniref:Protein SlyX homolog n=1 Tax=Agitococcus lubricus TaxID=1077255 RepID=A0A2T5J019_9GAMM|nr:SlyX family protein [Agitococcus lubricus]PTQ89692.1 SlyX protein [Agitococcus lubricus]